MKIFRSFDELHAEVRANLKALSQIRSVATIGNFDGVHRGHRMILNGVIESAVGRRMHSLAITFDPHPTRLLRPEKPSELITPLDRKLELLAETGIDATLVLPFTTELAELPASEFVRLVWAKAHIREFHEGVNFRFGRGAEGGIEDLIEIGRERGAFDVVAYDPYMFRGAPVSSSRIRSLLAAGEVSQARALLGRPFAIRSTPASGRGYGARYTVPTINLAPYTELAPANGVYITTLRIGDGSGARTFRAVTNCGNRPTFGADSFAIESYLLDFEPIALTEETPLELTFLKRLRAEFRFPSTEALREQISRDVRRANRYFSLCDKLATRNF